jgi:hypothetical protein
MKLLFENWRKYLKEQVEGSDFSQAIQSAQPGDLLRVQVLIPVEKYYQTIFKPGKLYNAAVSSDGNRITIETEPLPMGFGSEQTLTKDEFIENIHEQAKELGKTPCEIVACTRSEIIRGDKRKTFTEYLKNPTFEPKREPPPEIPAEVPAQEPVAPSDVIPQGPGTAAQIVSDDDIQDIMATFQARIAQFAASKPAEPAQSVAPPAVDIRALSAPLEPAAEKLRDEMLGAGSGKTVQIMIANKHQLAPLAAAFYKILTPEQRIKNGGLAQWLNDEVGCHLCKTMWAPKVEAATSKRNYKV